MNHPELLQYVENRLLDSTTKRIVYDSETDGLDWRRHRICGHVLTFSGDPRDSLYLPIRHRAGGNMDPDRVNVMLRSAARARPDLNWVFFNAAFDLKMMANDGIHPVGPLEDGQINSYLINENQRSFSLGGCCRAAGVQEKKEEDIYAHLAARFGGKPDRKQMGNFHLLPGDDPVGVDYATGDGTSTWQLRDWQMDRIEAEDLVDVWRVECRVIRVLHRMTSRGVRIDQERLEQVRSIVAHRLEVARDRLPPSFNERAPTQMKKLFSDAGIPESEWPRTEKGNASFPEWWLLKSEVGRHVVTARKLSNLENSFLNPLVNEHLWHGRVHCTYNQTRNETHGTVTGRLSSSNPNLHQCVAAGTKVTVPGGYKNVEGIVPGDWVYTYDDDLKLSLRRVTWSGQTGIKSLVRIHWRSLGSHRGGGRTEGHLDVTPDHRVRLTSGEYVRADALKPARSVKWKGRNYRGGDRVLALHRDVVETATAGPRNRLNATGQRFDREARFIFEQVHGWLPEIVHHVDEDSLNDDPDNLEPRTQSEHSREHLLAVSSEEKRRRVLATDPGVRRRVCDAGGDAAREKLYKKELTEEVVRAALEEAGTVRKAAALLGCGYSTVRRRLGMETQGNHRIIRVEVLPGEHPVYDITVDGTENFIANEVCVHNCPKRDEILGPIFRSLFVPEVSHIWGSPDYSQCLAAGTRVTIPGGYKNIEDMKIGDLVYSYDSHRRLVIRRVTWVGQTGVRSVCRVRWSTNGRTSGYIDVTSDHRIRLIDGTYKTVQELSQAAPRKWKFRKKQPYFIRVLALHRKASRVGKKEEDGYFRNLLHATGVKRGIPEARFIFEELNGWSPEVVHHADENSLNDDPRNLEGVTQEEHRRTHGSYGNRDATPEERKERSLVATRALQAKFRLIKNHYITHIIPIPGEQPVYDITVEDTHNFIANEICVHNCEPRLLAHYGRVQALIRGYLSDPPVDAHSSVATAAGIPRQAAKQLNQALITGSGDRHAIEMLQAQTDLDNAASEKILRDYFSAMPEIKNWYVMADGTRVRGGIQRHASNVMKLNGFVRSLLGRKARLDEPRFAYKALNRLLQCGNADILKCAMADIDEYLASEGDQVYLLNNVHDSLDFSYPPEYDRVYRECLDMMTRDYGPGRKFDLLVPLEVEEGSGANWAEASYSIEKVRKAFASMDADYDGMRPAA